MLTEPKPVTDLTRCANCQTALVPEARYCARCGQKVGELQVPLGKFIEESIDTIWHLNGKVPATLRVMFTQPGQLTRDFLAGRRARYMSPVRIYIYISVLFFLLVNQAIRQDLQRPAPEEVARILRQPDLTDETHLELVTERVLQRLTIADTTRDRLLRQPGAIRPVYLARFRQGLDSLVHPPQKLLDQLVAEHAERISGDTIVVDGHRLIAWERFGKLMLDPPTSARVLAMTAQQQDSVLEANGIQAAWDSRIMLRFMARAARNPAGPHLLENESYWHSLLQTISLLVYVLMPLVAALLLLAFRRQRAFYAEHLITALHAHGAVFLMLSVAFGYAALSRNDEAETAVLFATVGVSWLYIYLSLKRIYGQGWWRTLWKYSLLSVVYFTILAVLLFGALIYQAVAG